MSTPILVRYFLRIYVFIDLNDEDLKSVSINYLVADNIGVN